MFKAITAIAATLALTIGIAQAQTKTIKVAAFVPEKSVGVAKVIKPWMQAVQKDVGNAVRMQGFWGGTLGKSPTKQYELVKNGVADVTWVLPGYTAGQFPQMGVFELPFLFHNAIEASRVGWMLYKQGLLKGFQDVHLVGFFATEPNALFMRTPIANLGDLANKKIRSAGAIQAKWLEELKAAPQTLTSTAMNEALDRGTLDGVVQGWTGMKTFKTLPLVKQAYIVPRRRHPVPAGDEQEHLEFAAQVGSGLDHEAWRRGDGGHGRQGLRRRGRKDRERSKGGRQDRHQAAGQRAHGAIREADKCDLRMVGRQDAERPEGARRHARRVEANSWLSRCLIRPGLPRGGPGSSAGPELSPSPASPVLDWSRS